MRHFSWEEVNGGQIIIVRFTAEDASSWPGGKQLWSERERESETQNSSGEAGRSFSTLLLPGAGRGSTSCVPERLLQRCLEETLFTTSAVLLYSPHTNTTTTVALVVTLWGAQIIHSERPGNGGWPERFGSRSWDAFRGKEKRQLLLHVCERVVQGNLIIILWLM